MARPYQIMEKPVFVPYVCIQCGVGAPNREWFIDLGFSIDHYFDTANQAIYLCNECYHGMTLDVGRLLNQFRKDHEKWNSDVAPTYTWVETQREDVNDVREPESRIQDSRVGEDQSFDAGTASSTDRDDQDSESDDPEPESSDSGDAESTDDSDSDESTGFKITFGGE